MVTAAPLRPESGHDEQTGPRGPLTVIGARLPGRGDHPAWIRLLAIVAIVAAFGAAVTIALGAGSIRGGIDSLGHHTAPGVAATEDMASALADMDSQIGNLLLAGDDPALAVTRATALRTYEQCRVQAGDDLRLATTVAGGDSATQATLSSIFDHFGQYEALAANIQLLDASEHNPAGHPSPDILNEYRQATDLMATTLGTIQDLTHANNNVLQSAYTATRHDSVVTDAWLGVFAVVLFAALIGLQVMLRLTMRRLLNPALLVATVLALVLVIGGAIATTQAGTQLRIAKQDAFDSLLIVEQARAIGFDANADESRYLVDPTRAQQYEPAFFTKSQVLAQVDASTFAQYYPALTTAMGTFIDGNGLTIGGLFGDELHNIDFLGEDISARATLAAYHTYQQDDTIFRAQAETNLQQAISFYTSTDYGSSDGDFAAYNIQLNSVTDVNQHAFDAAIPAGINDLGGWTDWIPYALFALITIAAFLGIRPRLAEYR
ncbi:hypothetical protein [Nocardia alni]|uniref:hypothetical protein n=1 Tax=Nocardia alni TaxID=2815723 RepID=UPI001C2505DC|nr:hypothetical protein [Nocardia alni]